MDIINRLFELKDAEYAKFEAKLTPGIGEEHFIGVRVPLLRKLAKELQKDPCKESFLSALPHKYYEENVLHSILLSEEKDYGKLIPLINDFLPYVDNWAVCDTLSPKCFKKHKAELLPLIEDWAKSKETYTCRFGIDMLMTFYLDEDFKPEYLEIPAKVISEEYYVNMMIAWFFATALAKQWKSTIPYIEERRFGKWVNNKTIQKSCESYRISPEQKDYLKKFRM